MISPAARYHPPTMLGCGRSSSPYAAPRAKHRFPTQESHPQKPDRLARKRNPKSAEHARKPHPSPRKTDNTKEKKHTHLTKPIPATHAVTESSTIFAFLQLTNGLMRGRCAGRGRGCRRPTYGVSASTRGNEMKRGGRRRKAEQGRREEERKQAAQDTQRIRRQITQGIAPHSPPPPTPLLPSPTPFAFAPTPPTPPPTPLTPTAPIEPIAEDGTGACTPPPPHSTLHHIEGSGDAGPLAFAFALVVVGQAITALLDELLEEADVLSFILELELVVEAGTTTLVGALQHKRARQRRVGHRHGRAAGFT
ncbi:hypothetical protein B0H16DRAFT_1465395 [Mycena metata]|uniref:Uncharacterized protein n=1 Tax=Mycena metata TaxID=1033252 RepID=A0AAD7IB74_9AGAR|nr:hypothetical protein B0H16DRAFT_1465395 [Mycena metata]